MAQLLKLLAQGQLAAAKATVYTVPASTQTALGKLMLYNTGGSLETVILYAKLSGGSSRVIGRTQLASLEWGVFDLERVGLQAGDIVEAETTTATTVDYTVSALEIGL